jgi:hypothetical protein
MKTHKQDDIVELGSGESYLVQSVTVDDGFASLEAALVLKDGSASEHNFATLSDRDGVAKLVRKYRA